MKKKILFFDFKASEEYFFETNSFDDLDIKFYKESLNEYSVKNISAEDCESAEILSVFVTSEVDKDIFDKFPQLKLVVTRSTGYNHIDLQECKERNIAVFNVSRYGETTVAQYTFGLLIDLVRKIIPAVMDMKSHKINPDGYLGRDLNTLTLGILGTGAIGTRICEIANVFGMKILAYDFRPNAELAQRYNTKYVDFETLLKESDVVSIHVPYMKENHHLISKKTIEMMKDGAYLINTSRGELLDTNEVYQALLDKKLAGAALDVGECESITFSGENILRKIPGVSQNCLGRALVTQKLIELPNVIVTPHIAYNTKEAIETILETTFKNIDDFYNGIVTNRIF